MKSKGEGKVAVKKFIWDRDGDGGSVEWQSGAKGVQGKRRSVVEMAGEGGESDKCDKVMI